MPPTPNPNAKLTITLVRDAASIEHIRNLFTAYAATPGIGESLAIQKFQNELATLPAYYAPPGGELLLALDADGQPVGCIALRPLPKGSALAGAEKPLVEAERDGAGAGERADGEGDTVSTNSGVKTADGDRKSRAISNDRVCEMKRLYVAPSARGLGVGRALLSACLPRAKELGYEEVRLDTLPWMRAAIKLYAEFGFREIDAYHERWGTSNDELLFFAKTLV